MKKTSILLMILLLLSINVYSHDSEQWSKSKAVPFAVLIDSTLTFCYSKNKPSGAYDVEIIVKEGLFEVKEWNSKREQIKTVVFDKSFKKYRPKSCRMWFNNCTNLTSIEGIKEILILLMFLI